MVDWLKSILGGGVGVAAVAGAFKLLEIWQAHKLGNSRKRQKSTDDQVEVNSGRIDDLCAGMRSIMRSRIKQLAREYLAKNEIPLDDRQDLVDIHNCYQTLGGDLGTYIEKIMKIPVKKGEI